MSRFYSTFLKGNRFWVYTYFSLLVKTILLLAIATGGSMENISLLGVFISLPNFIVYLCFPAIILSFAFLFRRRTQFWFLVSINFAVSFLFVMDLWHYRAFGDFLSLHLIRETANLSNLQDSILSMVRIIDVIFFADIFVFIFKAFKGSSFHTENKRSFASFTFLLLIPVILIEAVHYELDVLHLQKRHQLFQICWSPNQTISNLSPLGYHFFDSYKYLRESGEQKLSPKDVKEIETFLCKKNENLPDNKYKGIFRGKNLIIIQVESLEGFVINRKVNGQEITPNLNSLLKNSLYFSDFYEQVHNGTSSDADLMTNTSVFPVRRGSTFFRYPNDTYNSLPKLLEGMGYYSLAIHPDKGAYWNWMKSLYSIGFDKCMDSSCFRQDEIIGLGLSDASFFRQVYPVVKSEKQPFYTFMVTLTSHGPFNLPARYREMNLDKKLDETKLGGYFQSVHYADKQIGSFLSKLKKDGLLDNTVVAVTGDHEGIHKFYKSEIQEIKPSESWWLENNKHVPFIIYNSSLKGEEIRTKGGQIDILPTISYLMGVDESRYSGTAIGRNLLKTSKDFVVLNNRKCLGRNMSSRDRNNAVKAIDISDKIIQGNYFKAGGQTVIRP